VLLRGRFVAFDKVHCGNNAAWKQRHPHVQPV
jgi:hypothetical protein